MKRLILFALVLAALLSALAMLAAGAAQPLLIEVYLIDPCGKCMGTVGAGCGECAVEREIAVRYQQLLEGVEYALKLYNLRVDLSLLDQRAERLAALDIPGDVPWPLMFIGDAAFLADGSQDEQIARYIQGGLSDYPGYDALMREADAAPRQSGNVVYLYSLYCESCRDVSKWLERALPEGYTLEKYDLATEGGVRKQLELCEKFGIPEEELLVPFIAYGDYHFMGKESIYVSLLSRIQEHPGL